MDDDDFGPPLPPPGANDKEEEEDDYGPPMPPPHADVGDEDEEDTDFESGDDEPEYDILPMTESIKLKDHRKTVSAVSVDPSGSRIVSGGRDSTLKMWDFNGMDQRFLPFRSIDLDGNPVREVQFSLSGDSFLVASGNSQARLYDREGSLINEFVKGDPYLRDMKIQRHTSSLTACRWHPSDKNTFITSSLDGTVRIWDINNKRQNTHVIAIKSKERGGRSPITSCSYSLDGNMVLCAGQDGEIRIYSSKAPYLRPSQSKEKAHIPGNIISSINISIDNHSVITRAFDDTLKLWDLRKFTDPVAIVEDLPNLYEETNAIFSPNDKLVVTGVSNRRSEKAGKLKFFHKADLSLVYEKDLGDSVVRTMWHSRINQILTTSSEGEIYVHYDQKVSASGAKLCADKKAKTKTFEDYAIAADETARVIYTPHALPMFRDEQPDFPLSGHGKGGKLGSSSASNMLKRVLKDTMRDEDPREAILKHAEAANADPYWVAPAYKSSQPKPLLMESVFEDELEEARAAKKRRPK
ncbi:transcription factor [Chytridium lagenaria]|nr:transcription factor [Chytridium lagenaria]